MKKLFITLAFLGSVPAFAAPKIEWNSVYTDLKKECVTIQTSNDKSEIDFHESDCKSFGGYRLQFGGGDIRYSPTLSFNGQEIFMNRPGSFHDLGSDKVEWVYKRTSEVNGLGTMEWKGLIFRLSVAKVDGEGSTKMLYAVRLAGEKSCFLGNPKTNEEARSLVRNAGAPCLESEQ